MIFVKGTQGVCFCWWLFYTSFMHSGLLVEGHFPAFANGLKFFGFESIPSQRISNPPLLILLIDGLRWDILDLFEHRFNTSLPGLTSLKKMGAYIPRVSPVFPAECYPNLYSLFTGSYPVEHGAIFSSVFDEMNNRSFTFDRHSMSDYSLPWLNSKGIWSMNSSQGKKISLYHLPICNNFTNTGTHCEYYSATQMTSHGLNLTLQRALKNIEDEKTDLSVIYYDELDRIGHQYGPLSSELFSTAIPRLDHLIQHLVDRLQSMTTPVNLIITSDHGMTTVKGVEYLDRFISPTLVKKVVNRGSTVGIWPVPALHFHVQYRLDSWRKKHFSVYNRSTIPERWHTGTALFPPILLVAKPGFLIHSSYWTIETAGHYRGFPLKGSHGYDTDHSDMHIPLFAVGPSFQSGSVLKVDGAWDQTNTHTLLAHLMGVLPSIDKSSTLPWFMLLVRSDSHLFREKFFTVAITASIIVIFISLSILLVNFLIAVWRSRCFRIDVPFSRRSSVSKENLLA